VNSPPSTRIARGGEGSGVGGGAAFTEAAVPADRPPPPTPPRRFTGEGRRCPYGGARAFGKYTGNENP